MRRPSEANWVTQNRLSMGSVAPISAVGTTMTAKQRQKSTRLKTVKDVSASPYSRLYAYWVSAKRVGITRP